MGAADRECVGIFDVHCIRLDHMVRKTITFSILPYFFEKTFFSSDAAFVCVSDFFKIRLDRNVCKALPTDSFSSILIFDRVVGQFPAAWVSIVVFWTWSKSEQVSPVSHFFFDSSLQRYSGPRKFVDIESSWQQPFLGFVFTFSLSLSVEKRVCYDFSLCVCVKMVPN